MNKEPAALLMMVLIRLFSGAIEIGGALLMFRLNSVSRAMLINGVLGLIGPMILLAASAAGIYGLASELPFRKVALVIGGVGLIFLATQ